MFYSISLSPLLSITLHLDQLVQYEVVLVIYTLNYSVVHVLYVLH